MNDYFINQLLPEVIVAVLIIIVLLVAVYVLYADIRSRIEDYKNEISLTKIIEESEEEDSLKVDDFEKPIEKEDSNEDEDTSRLMYFRLNSMYNYNGGIYVSEDKFIENSNSNPKASIEEIKLWDILQYIKCSDPLCFLIIDKEHTYMSETVKKELLNNSSFQLNIVRKLLDEAYKSDKKSDKSDWESLDIIQINKFLATDLVSARLATLNSPVQQIIWNSKKMYEIKHVVKGKIVCIPKFKPDHEDMVLFIAEADRLNESEHDYLYHCSINVGLPSMIDGRKNMYQMNADYIEEHRREVL